MTELQKNQGTENNAGCFGIGCSVIFPIVGIIMYFAKKNSVYNPSAYLYGALAGFTIGIIFQLIAVVWT